ncbi:uncharacterized protein CBL_12798 [Carabus blaptoides fortunei]
MSFAKRKEVIEENDTVILYLTISKMYAITVVGQITSKKGTLVENVFQATPYGALRVRELIGQKYGSKVSLSAGWGYVLQPTPELWTLTLPHRTQIIYTPDISMIIMQLDISPGSVVIESGTGSGSLSHALVRAVKPHGHLYTFDFHEQRCNTAREEFQSHGLSKYVTVRRRDVCENGFTDDLTDLADAVFLDLPLPWVAIPHAAKSLKTSGGRICTFSPCIEQVQKTCEVLRNLNFVEIQSMEVLQTQFSVQTRTLPIIKLDYLKVPKTEDENRNERTEKEIAKVLTAVTPQTMPGHTGYLTFATLLPLWARKQSEDVTQD